MIRRTWIQMGMPITVCLRDDRADQADVDAVAAWLKMVDQRFSPYRSTSEVCRLNAGAIRPREASDEMMTILRLCEQTRLETGGYFDVIRDGRLDPSGLVKGWAIERSSALLRARGLTNYVIDAGGDVQAVGLNSDNRSWRVGIRNPFQQDEVVKVLAMTDRGVATSGTAVRGAHIYNPLATGPRASDVVSLTVIGPSVYEADRFATAAFAMGREGLSFIAARPDLEAYAITTDGMATCTSGFNRYAG